MKAATKTALYVKVALLAFFLFMIGVSGGYPEKSALFPRILGGITSILIIVSLASDLILFQKKRKGKALAPDHPNVPPKSVHKEAEGDVEAGYEFLAVRTRKKRLIQALFVLLIALAIGSLAGFLWVVPFFFIAFGFLQGKPGKKLSYIIVALLFTGGTYFLFVVLMGVPLLRGLWWG